MSDDRKRLFRLWADGYEALRRLSDLVTGSGIAPSLLELVKLRVSQINGCAYCIDMHSKDARAAGETEQRLYAINVWHDTPFFTEPERAALAAFRGRHAHRGHACAGDGARSSSGALLTGRAHPAPLRDRRDQRVELDSRSPSELPSRAVTSRPNPDDLIAELLTHTGTYWMRLGVGYASTA